MYGWMGRILHVDLNNSKITQFSTQPYAEKYLGGRGIATRIYWETVSPEVRAFDPQNLIIFMTGPLVATGAQGATRMSLVGKSPMASLDGFCYANIGGFFPAELKKAGWDGIVVEGRAPKPVYLWIHDNEAALRDASSLWGQDVYRVKELLEQTHGEKVRFITTGVAGERMVRIATGVGSHDSTFSAGFGAVMGSKNLKALAVIGTGKPSVADLDGLKELNRYTAHICRRVKMGIPPQVIATGRGHLLEPIGKGACYQCGMSCIRNKFRYGGRLVANRRCQPVEYYLPWTFGQEDEPLETFFDAPTLANAYSICTFELRSMVNWLYDCYQSGCLTEQETGLPLSKIGTREFLERLLYSITYREGFGDILAEGIFRTREKVSAKARALMDPCIQAIGHGDEYPPRAFVAHALMYPMEPRASQTMHHELYFTWTPWDINRVNPDASPITTEVFLKIAKAFWGSEEAGYLTNYDKKALAAKILQNRVYLKESLGLCDFGWSITYSLNTPDHVGDPDLEAKLFTAVTDVDSKELDRYAERIFNLQRAIMVREGKRIPEGDYPPEFNFTNPLGTDKHFVDRVFTPGPGGEIIDTTGNMLDRDKYTSMLKEYYQIRGWDQETGIPKAETLAALGLEDVASVFKSQ